MTAPSSLSYSDRRARLDAIRSRARRNWNWLLRIFVAAPTVALSVFATLHPRNAHHHTAGSALRLLILFLALLAMTAWFVPRNGNEGRFSRPLIGGLPRAQRRSIRAAVRAGEPSAEPISRAVEEDFARWVLAYKLVLRVVLGLLCAGLVLLTVIADGYERVYPAVLAVTVALLLSEHERRGKRAAAFMAAADRSPRDKASPAA